MERVTLLLQASTTQRNSSILMSACSFAPEQLRVLPVCLNYSTCRECTYSPFKPNVCSRWLNTLDFHLWHTSQRLACWTQCSLVCRGYLNIELRVDYGWGRTCLLCNARHIIYYLKLVCIKHCEKQCLMHAYFSAEGSCMHLFTWPLHGHITLLSISHL